MISKAQLRLEELEVEMNKGTRIGGKSHEKLSKLGNTTFVIPWTGPRKADRSGKRPALRQKAVWHLSRHFVRLWKNLFELFHLQAG